MEPDEDGLVIAVIAAVSDSQWHQLRELADEFREHSEASGDWTSSVQGSDGIITLGWFSGSEKLQEFVKLLYDADLVSGAIDWVSRIDGMGELSLSKIEAASPVDLVCMITAMVRSDRFNEGALAGFIESGMLPAAVLRLAEQ